MVLQGSLQWALDGGRMLAECVVSNERSQLIQVELVQSRGTLN